MVALEEVADINPRPEAVADDTQVSFIGMADLDATTARTTRGQTRRFAEVSKGYTVFRCDDILVAKITPCFENCKIGQAHLDHRVGVGSTEFHVVRPHRELLDRYVLHYLRQDSIRVQGESRMTGSAGQRRVPADYIKKLRLPLPQIDEQRRIANILDDVDAIRAMRRQTLVQLDELSRSTFLNMFGSPATWADRWQMGTIGDLADDIQYGTAAKAGGEGAWPIIRMGNLTDDGRLDLSDLKWIDLSENEIPKFTVQRGDLLFNRTNSREKVGKTCVVDTDQPLAFAGYLVRVRMKTNHPAEYVNAFMTSHYGRAMRYGMAKAAINQANINATEMRSIPIALPPTCLQQQFARAVADINAQRERHLRALVSLDELFAAVQSRAFTGQL